MRLPGEMNKQMGAPYVRAAPLNVCFRHHPVKDALRASGEKKTEREKKLGVHRYITRKDEAVAGRDVES